MINSIPWEGDTSPGIQRDCPAWFDAVRKPAGKVVKTNLKNF